MAKKIFTDESLATLIDETKSYVDDAVSTKADSGHTHTISNISDLTATATELNYMDGVTSSVQTQLDGKAASSHNHDASNVTSGTLSSDRLPTVPITKGGTGATTASGALTNLGLTATATELNYVDGVTSNIQTQLDAKASTSTVTQSANGLMSAGDKIQIDYGGIPIVTTAGDGSAYTVTVDGITELKAGTKITIIPHVVSAAYAPTLNVNSLGAKAIRMPVSYNSSASANGSTTTWLAANRPVTLEYNGTYWLTIGLTRPSANYLYGTVPIENGGTGATTVAAAKTNLEIPEITIVEDSTETTLSELKITKFDSKDEYDAATLEENAMYAFPDGVDFIVEEGSNDNWTWRKWNSGIAECWGVSPDKSFDINTAWGNMYISSGQYNVLEYPFEFVENPVCMSSHFSTNGSSVIAVDNGASTSFTTQTPIYQYARPTVATTIVRSQWYAKGKWK